MSSVTDRARNLLDMRQDRQAVTLLETHLATSPADAVALGLLARALTATDRHDDAAASALRAVRLEPTDAYLLVLYAHCMVNASQYDNAVAADEQAVRLAPGYLWAHETLARAFAGLSRFEEADAAVAAAQVLAEPTEDAQAAVHSLRSIVLQRQPGRLAAAIEQAATAARLSPQNDWYRTRLAQLQLIADQHWLAVRTATDVLTSAPTTAGARGTLLLATHRLQKRMLWAQFLISMLTALLVLLAPMNIHSAARAGSLLALLSTAVVAGLMLRGAPISARLGQALWNTVRPYPGSVIALVLQAVVVLLALAGLITGNVEVSLVGWLVILLAAIAFGTSDRAMVEAASRAFGRSEAEVAWDLRD